MRKAKEFLLTIRYLKGYSIELIITIKRETTILNTVFPMPLKRQQKNGRRL